MLVNNLSKNLIIFKLIAIGVLIVLLLAPTVMIRSLISERENRRESAVSEVSSKWGASQRLAGPILSVPYRQPFKDKEDKIIEEIRYAFFLPSQLKITGQVLPQTLKRGIYEIVVYKADLGFRGKFSAPDFGNLNIPAENVMWDQAIVNINIPDMRGINQEVKIRWDAKQLEVGPGTNLGIAFGRAEGIRLDDNEEFEVLPVEPMLPGLSPNIPETGLINSTQSSSGVSAKVALAEDRSEHDFDFDINLNGSQELSFLPLGSQTDVSLSSDWPTPSFGGVFLPDSREVGEDGFKAEWKVLELNRNFPSSWLAEAAPNLAETSFGVKLLVPVDEYQKIMRSVKYALMLIVLTFLIFFFVEALNKKRIHPIQYVLVGLALVLFFSLLLALSEHINFNLAYLLAGLATILAVSLYTKSIFKSLKLTSLLAGCLIIIYAFIFVIIQLQDYALLVGNLGLFVVLVMVMYVSRKVDWYVVGRNNVLDSHDSEE